jgi:hypothetical protein
MSLSAEDRSRRASIAALTRSASEDGAAMSEKARATFRDSFDLGGQQCRLCGIHPVIDPGLPAAERSRRGHASYLAHMKRLSALALRRRNAVEELAGGLEVIRAQIEQLADEAL